MPYESPDHSARVASPPIKIEQRLVSFARRVVGFLVLFTVVLAWISLASWSVTDPSLTHATSGATRNLMGALGAIAADLLLQSFGLASLVVLIVPMFWGVDMVWGSEGSQRRPKSQLALFPIAVFLAAGALSSLPVVGGWPLHHGFGGIIGDTVFSLSARLFGFVNASRGGLAAGVVLTLAGTAAFLRAIGVALDEVMRAMGEFASASRTRRSTETYAGRSDFEPRLSGYPGPELQGTGAGSSATRFDGSTHGLTQGVARAWSNARHTARRGVDALNRHAARLSGAHAANGLSSARDGVETSHGAPYGHFAARGMMAPQSAHGSHGQPYGAMADDPSRGSYPHVGAQPAAYVPPHSPMPGLRPPSRGPAAHLRPGHDQQARPFPHDAVDPFDVTTEEASRAIARRFAPAAAAQGWAEEAFPALPANAAPLHSAQTSHVAHGVTGTPAAPVPPVLPPQASAVAQAAAADAGRQKPQKRNALFGGLAFRHQGGPALKLPPLSLLKKGSVSMAGPELTQTVLRGNARLLEDVLGDFGVKGEVREIRPGPVVTLFEFEPARGTKSARVIGLADDIARSMSATAVRVAVVPGRNAIGIELPNVRRDTVLLRDVLEAEAFKAHEAGLPIALGKSIGGEPVVADLARMPHLLVAGTTGSGKSVGVNAMILSLIYRMSPDDCRFLMIDPKMLELSVYNGIPHLLAPVVTDPQKAVTALNWVVAEMEERYKRMSKLSVRSIDVFNNRVRNAKKRGEMMSRTVQTGFDRRTGEAVYEQEQLQLETMPYIVVVIDEFADLMLVAGKEVEASVQRLAQMARAAGIHIIMATQRPSVDVITGTIKANFPTRISFKVTSKIDSRTILNEQGAEQLLGQGDMLYAGGNGQITRVHGAFVSDEEVEAIAGFVRQLGAPNYVAGITDEPAPQASAGEDGNGKSEEDLYDRAVAIVLRDRKASTSYLQRRLSIGYNRAADLIERMEAEGLISAANSVGKREILSEAGRARDTDGAADAA